MDGLETLAEIKKVRPDQVVIILTGLGSLESVV
jgi:DNA-binding NtrC family response regulator